MHDVVFAIQQVGPYHHARFQALSGNLNVLVIETRPKDSTYSWVTNFPDANYRRVDFNINPFKLAKIVGRKPIFICGWYDKEMLLLLGVSWFVRTKRIIISDSRSADSVRVAWKERLKQLILKFYNAALVAGAESEAYLRQLHFTQPVEKPWDVVDEKAWKPPFGILKGNYWVFPARLIEKKNHAFFLSAYAQAIENIESPPLLHLCGDGPLQMELEHLVKKLGVEKYVIFKGFVQTDEMKELIQKALWVVLPSKYDQWGLVANEALSAKTRVLISDNCGAKELITQNVNGIVYPHTVSLKDLVKIILQCINKKIDLESSNFMPKEFEIGRFVDAVKLLSHVGQP
jgi:glycosyltransferase involved in cell wall biosynthesis